MQFWPIPTVTNLKKKKVTGPVFVEKRKRVAETGQLVYVFHENGSQTHDFVETGGGYPFSPHVLPGLTSGTSVLSTKALSSSFPP